MKVLILGASGIVGQHMRLCVPDCVESTWMRQTGDLITFAPIDGNDLGFVGAPDVIVNLAGCSNVDEVERHPMTHYYVNRVWPANLAR